MTISTIKKLRDFYSTPKFSKPELKQYFQFSIQEEELIGQLIRPGTKICFMLQLGVFKKYQRFISYNDITKLQTSIEYLIESYFTSVIDIDLNISRGAYDSHKAQILNLLGFKKYSFRIEERLEVQLDKAVSRSMEESYLVKEAVEYLTLKSIALPDGPRPLERLVFASQKKFLKRIQAMTRKISRLKELSGLGGSKIKTPPINHSHSEVYKEIGRLNTLKESNSTASLILNKLNLSDANIRYLSKQFTQFSDTDLCKDNISKIRYACFVKERTQQSNDYLIEAYNLHLGKLLNDEKEFADKLKIKEFDKIDNISSLLPQIIDIIIDPTIDDGVPFGEVRKKIYRVCPELRLIEASKNMKDSALKRERIGDEFFDANGAHTEKLLTAILKALGLETIKYTKLLKDAVKESSQNISRFERIKLFKQIKNRISSGEIFKEESKSFKSFNSDLIPDENWEKSGKKLIKNSNLPILSIPIEKHLDDLEEELEELYEVINQRKEDGELSHISKGRNGRIKLSYINSPKSLYLNNLLDDLESVPISDVLQLSLKNTRASECFSHLKSNKIYSLPDSILTAAILAQGTNLGIYRMSKICNFDYKELKSIVGKYISPQNLNDANAKIIANIKTLPIFKYYHLEDDIIYSSSDGQKFETQYDNISSRYSSKYFGLGKGISNYSLIANHIPINAKIISANEYEGHHLLDLLLNNQTDVIPDIHCSDGNGQNQVNFALLNIFGYQFAPRIKGLSKGKYALYGFNNLKEYSDSEIRPCQRIDRNLIIKNWDELCRIFISLKEKKVSQSILVKKLSNYRVGLECKKALWEYNNIIRSIYLLNFLQNNALRQNVQKSLNIGENYHQIKRAIAFANAKGLKGRNPLEQEIWSESARLVANSIIYYNSLILSHLHESNEAKSNGILSSMIESSSPISWAHINLMGRYEFNELEDTGFWMDSIGNVVD